MALTLPQTGQTTMDDNKPKKELGQHWLHDIASLRAMATAADIRAGDTVLEVGPGLGTLTQVLLDKGAKVTAVEFDTELANKLTSRLGNNANLQVIQADIRKFDFGILPPNYKIVANIPYYLTSHLLRLLAEAKKSPIRVALLVQKEVAQRVCASPGETSLLSVMVQMYFECSLGNIVPANLFTPPPKVDSQILILNRRDQAYFGSRDQKQLTRLIKAGFSERRKKLRSSLSGGLNMPKESADALLASAGISGDLRAQNLSLDQWLVLYDSWHLT